MNRKTFGFVLVAVAFAVAPASAQFIGRTVTVAQLGACQNSKAMAYVTDATNATTLGAGGGNASVFVNCASGSWAIDSVEDVSSLTGYIQSSEAAQVGIEATGAGNDVTLTAADDVILVPADALTATVGGAAAITTTAGAITLTAGGTTEDASIISTDDIFLTPDDALTAVAGGAVTLTGTAGTVAIAASAGAVTVTAVGATNDVTLTAADDVILAATDDTTVAGDQFAVNTTTVVIDAGGTADEITVAAGSTTVLGTLILPIASAPPAACAAGTKGAVYYDSDINKLCICNATNYVLANDDATTTGCS